MDAHYKKIFRYTAIIALASFASLFALGVIHGGLLGSVTPRQLTWAYEQAKREGSGETFGNLAPVNEREANENSALLRHAGQNLGWPLRDGVKAAIGAAVVFLLFATLHSAVQELLETQPVRKWALVFGACILAFVIGKVLPLPNTSYHVVLAVVLAVAFLLFDGKQRFRTWALLSLLVGFLYTMALTPVDRFSYLFAEIIGGVIYHVLEIVFWSVPALVVGYYLTALRGDAAPAVLPAPTEEGNEQ